MSGALVRQGGRYLLAGAIVYLADLLTFAVIAHLAPSAYLWANLLGKSTGAALGFVLHKRFTFAGGQRDRTDRQAASYALLLMFNLALSSALLWVAVEQLGIRDLPARILVDGVVILISFLGMRLWVYRPA